MCSCHDGYLWDGSRCVGQCLLTYMQFLSVMKCQ